MVRIEDVWYGGGLAPSILRALLVPFSGLYWLGWQGYAYMYRLGLKRAKAPHKPVVCIGSLAVGGSGKTPATTYLAKLLLAMGHKVVIGASGYGSPSSHGATLAPDGELRAIRWGDEPAMIRRLLPEVPLVVGRDRVRAAELCHETYSSAVLLMDDGLQHLPLKKHLQICLEDPRQHKGLVLPAGAYREPRASLGRMDAVAILSTDNAEESPQDGRAARLDGYSEKPRRFELRLASSGFFLNGEAKAKPPGRASVLCALARPDRFVASVLSQGISIEAKKLLPDHDPLTAGNLFEGLPPDLPIVVTAKDWVKLRERPDLGGLEIYVAMQEARIEPEEEFKAWLGSKLDEIAKA